MSYVEVPCGCEDLQVPLGVQLKNMDVADLTPEHLGPCACVTFLITRIDFQAQC